ncbi:MAG: autotransporter-associated beta strand repeat-containing protein [Opitutaceae bacterium]|nr:autotransporter-associated beta strand repeat-containing protein [Opitutaceae bacterium]
MASVILAAMAFASAAHAATLYWDNNGTTTGFGNAGGNWAQNSTSGGTSARWKTDANGVLGGSATQTTTSNDIFNLGTSTNGLGSGTINVNAAGVTMGNTIFGSLSGNVTFSGGTITFSAAPTITTNNVNSTNTFNTIIAGAATSLTKAGDGTLLLTAANTYAGQTNINAGTLRFRVGGSSANSKVVLAGASATHSISVTNNTQTWTCAELAPTAAGKLEFNFGAISPGTTVSPLTVTGLADFTAATPTVSVITDAALPPGTYPLMTWGSTTGTAPSTSGLTVSTVAAGTAASLAVSNDGLTLNLVITSTIVPVLKNNTATNLDQGGSWVGGVAPTAVDVAKWDSAVTSPSTTSLGSDLTWSGITIGSPTGSVTINAGNTLTLGAAAADIDMSAATADLTLNNVLALGEANLWSVAASRTLTLGGKVTGAFGITKAGDGTAVLSSAANDYSGATIINAGTLKLGADNVIPDSIAAGNVAVNGTLDLNGNSDVINGLSGAGIIDNLLASSTATLTVFSNEQSTTFSGVIRNSGTGSTLNLAKTGGGTLTLSGANTYTGTTTVSAGILSLANTSALANTAGISLAGGSTLVPSLTGIVIDKPITLGAAGTTATITAPNVAGSGTTNFPVTINGTISGDGNVDFSGVSGTNAYGVVILNTPASYSGSTLLTTISAFAGGNINNANIFFRLGVANALPVTTVVTLDGGDGGGTAPGRFAELNLNGFDQTLAGLTNVTGRVSRVQRVVNNSGTAATLTINNTADYAYSGQLGWVSGYGSIAYNNFGLTKSGAGKFTISGPGTYTGATTINGGTLELGASNSLPAASAVSIGAGTLAVGTGVTAAAGTLDVTGAATINLGSAQLAFADSSAIDWTGGTLNIVGTLGANSLRFGTNSGSLIPAQLALISVNGGGAGTYTLDENGFLVGSGGGNTAPTISDIANRSVPSGGTTGALAVTVGDTETAADSLLVGATSGNTTLVPNGNILIGGTGANRTVTVTPTSGLTGTATITVTVTDGGGLTATDTFTVTVTDNYLSWATTNSVTGGVSGDSDNDGVKNLVEYALVNGGERGVLNGNTLTFTKRGTPFGGDVSYAIETSTDLVGWSTALSGVSQNATTISYTFTPGAQTKIFARLKVTQQ